MPKNRQVPEAVVRRLLGLRFADCCPTCHTTTPTLLRRIDLGKGRYALVCCVVFQAWQTRRRVCML